MSTHSRFETVIVLAALAAAVPPAHAVDACVADACASTWNYSGGEGDCGSTPSDYYQAQTAGVTAEAAGVYSSAGVYQNCGAGDDYSYGSLGAYGSAYTASTGSAFLQVGWEDSDYWWGYDCFAFVYGWVGANVYLYEVVPCAVGPPHVPPVMP